MKTCCICDIEATEKNTGRREKNNTGGFKSRCKKCDKKYLENYHLSHGGNSKIVGYFIICEKCGTVKKVSMCRLTKHLKTNLCHQCYLKTYIPWNKQEKVVAKCLYCKISFKKRPNDITKFCSHKCYSKSLEVSPEQRKATKKRLKDSRTRKFNWIKMFPNPFSDNIEIDWHHINNAYVVAIPRELHRLYNGKYHREKAMEIVKQIYLIA